MKKLKEWREILAVLILLICVTLGGAELIRPVVSDPPETATETGREEPVKTSETEGETAEHVKLYDYDLSQYLTMGEVSPVRAKFDDPTVCTDREVDDAIFQILLRHASFDIAAQRAELYYKVNVDLSVWKDGAVLPQRGKTDCEIIIGLYSESEENVVLGGALIGACVGDQRKAEYTYPAQLDGDELAGQTVELIATVKSIRKHNIPTLIDANVAEMTGNAFTTVKALRESVKQDILLEKKTARAQAVWLAIKEGATVLKYPEKEMQDTLALYYAEYEALAKRFDLTLEQLVTVYMESDMETFAAEAKVYAEEKVKNDMIMTQLVRLLNVTLTEEEYQAGAKEYFEKEEEGKFATFEEFVEFYTEENLRRNLLWDKALRIAEENAVQIR